MHIHNTQIGCLGHRFLARLQLRSGVEHQGKVIRISAQPSEARSQKSNPKTSTLSRDSHAPFSRFFTFLEERVIRIRWIVSVASSTPTLPGFIGKAAMICNQDIQVLQLKNKSQISQNIYSETQTMQFFSMRKLEHKQLGVRSEMSVWP